MIDAVPACCRTLDNAQTCHSLYTQNLLPDTLLDAASSPAVIAAAVAGGGGGGGGGGNGINGENGELLMGFSIFSIEIVSILCHFMPFYAIENLKNLEFRKKLFLTNFQSQFQRTKVFTYYDFTS